MARVHTVITTQRSEKKIDCRYRPIDKNLGEQVLPVGIAYAAGYPGGACGEDFEILRLIPEGERDWR